MHQELQDRYGSWAAYSLLPAVDAQVQVEWPGRDRYGGRGGLMVGPDAGRWVWCPHPPGGFDFPQDFRVCDIRVSGTAADGRSFAAARCAPSAISIKWSAGQDVRNDLFFQVEDEEFLLQASPPTGGPFEVRWVLTNALFGGQEMAPDPEAGPGCQRRSVIRFASPNREWELRLLPNVRDAERAALEQGVVKSLPTAELVAEQCGVAEIAEAEEEAYAVTRLLSLATGGSVGGGVRRLYRDAALLQESFFEWPRFGGAESVRSTATVANDGLLGWGLTQFLGEAVGPYRSQDAELSLSQTIGYLEQARSTPLIEGRILFAILALETLTYRLCLKLGSTPDQLAGTNIQQKLNTVRGRYRMGFIDRRFAEGAREAVRNPLVHSGSIPALTMPEKVKWADDLYALAFKMVIFLLGYTGRWYDPSSGFEPAAAPVSS